MFNHFQNLTDMFIRIRLTIRNITSIIILLASFPQIFSQKIVTTYYNPYWFLSSKEYSEFYRVAMIDTTNYKFYGFVKDYYKNGNLQMTGNYQANIKNGNFLFYYPDGNLKTSGFYKDNKRWGIWTNFYENGKIKDKIVFNDIFLSVLEYYDENGNPKITKGTGDWETHYFNDFGISNVRITGSFNDSLRNGTWKYYTDYIGREENQYEILPMVEIYENGKFITGEFYRHDGSIQKMNLSTIKVLPETTKFENIDNWKASIYASIDEYPFLRFLPRVDSSYFPVNKLAVFPGGTDSLTRQIWRQLKLKKSYIKSQQLCICMFKIIVNEKGILEIEEDQNISMLKLYPGNELFYRQVLKALPNLPKWDPAVRHQRKVKSHFMLTISLDKGLLRVNLSNTNQMILDPDLKLISELASI